MNISQNRLIGARAVGDGSYQLVFPGRVLTVGSRAKSIPAAVRWSFLAFVFTIPFEAADFPFTSGSLSLARLAAVFFFMAYLFYYNPLSRDRSLPRIPPALWWFLGYLAIYILNGPFGTEEFRMNFVARLVTLIQLMGLFWLASSLLKDEKLAKNALLIYSVASVVLAVGTMLDLPGFSVGARTVAGATRTTTLEYDPNKLGISMSIAAVALIGLSLTGVFKNIIGKALLPVMILPLLISVVKTGSRTGIAVFVIGCSAYLLPQLQRMHLQTRRRLSMVVLAILGLGLMGYVVVSNPDALERWKQTYYEGRVGGREKIIDVAVEMILERPIFGWHPGEFSSELGLRLGIAQKGGHNLFLDLLMEVGIVGTIPFLVGLWLCGRASWRARGGNLGYLPVATFLTVLSGSLANPFLINKIMWLVLALTIAVASAEVKGKGLLLVRRHGRRTA